MHIFQSPRLICRYLDSPTLTPSTRSSCTASPGMHAGTGSEHLTMSPEASCDPYPQLVQGSPPPRDTSNYSAIFPSNNMPRNSSLVSPFLALAILRYMISMRSLLESSLVPISSK